jgi:uncharacterized ferredoxin-like protein
MPNFNPQNAIIETANFMCVSAITAPKTKGVNLLTAFYLLPNEYGPLYEGLEKLSKKYDDIRVQRPYERDLETLKKTDCLVVISSRKKLMDIAGCDACGFSGEPNGCKAAALAGATCAYNSKDLGIAACSAAIVAHQRFIDNRIIDTVGRVIINFGFYRNYTQIDAFDAVSIALSVSGKNPFYDRLEGKLKLKR